MQKRDATERFQLTKTLFAAGRYTEALDILNALDEAFPDTKNILYPRALCLARLGRYKEALDISQQLVVRFSDARAQCLLDKLTAPAPVAPAAGSSQQSVQPPPPMPVSLAGLEALDQQRQPGAVPQVRDVSSLFADEEEAGLLLPFEPPRRRLGPVIAGIAVAAVVVAVLAGSLFLLVGQHMFRGGADSMDPATGEAPTMAAEKEPQTSTTQIGVLTWYTDHAQGIQAQSAAKAPALLFFTDGSSECERMEQEVFSEPSIIQLLSGWVLVRVNGQTQPEACAYHDVAQFPSMVILDATGMAVDHEVGVLTARQLYDKLIELNLQAIPMSRVSIFLVTEIVVFLVSLLNLPLYFTLRIVAKLPHEALLDNMLSIVGMSIVLAFLNSIPIIGFFIGIYVLTKKYEMAFGDWLIYFGLQLVYAIVVFVALYAAMGDLA